MNRISLSVFMFFLFTSLAHLAVAGLPAAPTISGEETEFNSDLKSSVTLNMGVALPLGDFGKEAVGAGIDGAGSGLFLSLDYAYAFHKNISAMVGLTSIAMAANPETIKIGSNTLVKSGWDITAIMAGAQYQYALGKFMLKPCAQIGWSMNNSGNMSVSSSGQYTQLSDLPSYNSFAYQVGIKMAYPFLNRWEFNVNGSYFGSQFKYQSLTKKIAVANLGLGICFMF